MGFELIKCGLGTGLVGLLIRWLVPFPSLDPAVIDHYWSLFVSTLQFFALAIEPALLLASVLMMAVGVAVWTITALLATYRRKVAA